MTALASSTVLQDPERPADPRGAMLLTGEILPTLLRLSLPNLIALCSATIVSIAETAYVGSLGVWQVLPDGLPEPRAHGAPVVATTPEGDTIVYLVGGTTDGSTPETDVLAMIPPGPWFVAGSMQTGRMDLGADRAGYDVAPALLPDSPDYLVAMQGDDGGGATNTVEAAVIGAGGLLDPFFSLTDDANGQSRVDGRGLCSASHCYFLGGGGSSTEAESSGRQASIDGPGMELGSWSSTSASGTFLVPRADFGLAPLRATLYAAGGRTDTADATTSVEQVVY